MILDICSSLKKAKPEALIILGGPEVSYDAADILIKYSFVDYIVIGEGEATLLDLLYFITAGKGDLSKISGIAYRAGADIVITEPRSNIPDMDMLPFPYDSFDGLENKIIYYETSRGCPFNCQNSFSSLSLTVYCHWLIVLRFQTGTCPPVLFLQSPERAH